MITEGNADPDMIKLFYGNANGSRLGAHFTFNFITFLSQLHRNFTGLDLLWSIKTWWDAVPSWGTNNWLLGNHDNTRVSTRLGVENIDALNMVASLLPGAQITYQGEEIGQENGNVTCEEGTDPQAIKNCTTFAATSRDFERTPFQWDNSTNAGFNDGAKTWLPVSEKYIDTNLAKQNITDVNSHYNIYKQMLKLRREFEDIGDIVTEAGVDDILCVQRFTANAKYVLYYNVGDSEAVFPTFLSFCTVCEDCMTVAVRSLNSEYNIGDKFNISQPLKPREAVLSKVAYN
jgi:alpha-glucosidase